MIRYDALLVQYLARELNDRLAGAGARTLRLDPSTRVAALETTAGTLVLDLHPSHGIVSLGAPPAAETVIALHRRTAVARVTAPADERLLILELAGAPVTRIRRLVVELMGNQWNALALDGNDRIVQVLWARGAGGRTLRAGAPYVPPPASGRLGAGEPLSLEEWLELLEPVAPGERERALVARVAWTSPLNAGPLLGSAAAEASTAALEEAYGRYRLVAGLPAAHPCICTGPGQSQPFALSLPCAECRPVPTLLEAIALAGGVAPPLPPGGTGGAPLPSPELLERVRRRLRFLETRAKRLETQAAGALEEAVALRGRADVLLANLHALRKGAQRVVLPDFTGGEVEIELDPALAPSENATRLYEEARRREHAAERVPALVAAVEAERARLAGALLRAEAGQATAEELEVLERAGAGPGSRRPSAEEERLPYRRYRTSGGLEVRVGRSRRDNDALTLHHSSPNDVWLHARDAGGAHVLLRWPNAEANPPHRDLVEAAVLAALHSKARTSGVVPVDWTRRKYVRKPRKATPGLVVSERVKTIFVEPDDAVEKRLRS